jgi:hypothetical protein
MRTPRGGTPIWLMMVAVASLALMMGIGTMKVRAKGYQARAASHAARQAQRLTAANRLAASPSGGRADRLLLQAEHHNRMRQKYSEAARRPWTPIPPDPPEPQ